MNSRNTKQKALIMDILKEDKSHPTILELYEKVNAIDPTIGQATVYRNVNKLVAQGKIKRLAVHNDVDHYDGNIMDHGHLVCTKCGKIIDVFDNNIEVFLKRLVVNNHIVINDSHLLFEGICSDCCKEV